MANCKASTPTFHFDCRYSGRNVDKFVDYYALQDIVNDKYSKGEVIEDKKHKGLEGPRYHVYINIHDKKVVVTIEKTKSCLKLITVWVENFR